MSIKDEIKSEMKDAMKSRDQNRLDALRQLETEVMMAKTAPGFKGEADDALYTQVITAYAKKMTKARDEYLATGDRGKEMAEKLSFEVTYLGRWLPKKLDEVATRDLITKAITELGVAGPQAVGRVVGHVIKSHKDQIDSALVNKLVKEILV